MLANVHCEWNEQKGSSKCTQAGLPSAQLTAALERELQKLGLPEKEFSKINYRVWAAASGRFTLAEASYNELSVSDLLLCGVIVVFKNTSELHVIRYVGYQKTDADVPTITTWSPLDIANVDGDGRDEIVLEGDSYEDHWFEVVSVGDDLSSKTIFSGLGYYL